MPDYLNALQLYDWAIDWIRSNVLIATNAEQLATVAGIFAFFLLFVRPLSKFFISIAERFSVGAIRQILLPLALSGPWLLLLLAFWFTTLVFAERHFGTTILRLAESLTLAWVIIKLSSRLVRNDRLARALAVLVFMIAALNIAGLLGTVTGLLDSMAVYVGSLRVSVLLLIKGAVTLALFLWLASTFARVLETRLKRLSELTPAMQVLTSKLVRFALVTLAIILALGSVGIDLTALAVFSGAVGVGVGLGLQKVVSNLVSGAICPPIFGNRVRPKRDFDSRDPSNSRSVILNELRRALQNQLKKAATNIDREALQIAHSFELAVTHNREARAGIELRLLTAATIPGRKGDACCTGSRKAR